MHGRGAKGSLKNRMYHFWIIRIILKRKKKRKEEKELKKKRKEEFKEKRRREILELFKEENPYQKLKLVKNPVICFKKEGTVIVLHPTGRKPVKLVAVYEKPKKVGIAPEILKKDTQKQLVKLTVEVKITSEAVKKTIEEKPKNVERKKQKKENLKKELLKVKEIQNKYHDIVKKNPKIVNQVVVLPNENKKVKVGESISQISKLETLCTQELKKLEHISNIENKDVFKNSISKKDDFRKNKKIQNQPTKMVKTGAYIAMVSGGTLIVFPSLLHKMVASDSKKENFPSQKKINESQIHQNQVEEKKTSLETKVDLKLKLYKDKLDIKKDAEIMIQKELEKQKEYLKQLNKKVSKLEVTVQKKYQFKGINYFISNLLKLALGLFTIPFSKKRLFGTAMGVTLINNGLRGIKNSLKPEEKQISYIEFKDFSNIIYNEKLTLLKTKDLIDDSLWQLKDLKAELETEFYGKVPFQEYDEINEKLIILEKNLLEKQKEVEQVKEELEKAEEKNKVKMKKMEHLKK